MGQIDCGSIASPCTRICIVDPALKLCVGCGRTLDEIAGWIERDNRWRARVIAQLPARLAAIRGAPVRTAVQA
jgi:predicted Fe-S protein YdhL (DUF1289 family)